MRSLNVVSILLFRDRVMFGKTVLHERPVDFVYARTMSFVSFICFSQFPFEKLAYGAACSIVMSSSMQ